MKKILVTGGAGFIGSHIAEGFVQRGHAVTVLDDLSGGFEENVPRGAEFVRGSVVDVALVNDLFQTHKFDAVYHLAAYAAEGLSHFIRNFNYTNNVIGSINLINASVNTGVKLFVFTSSIAVYGASPVLPLRESDIPHPEDPYGVAKLAVEQDLLACNRMFGMDYVIFRPHNVYGERQNIGDRYRNVVGIFMNQILQGKPMTIFGDGSQTRAFSYIGDLAPIMLDALDTPAARNHIFNVGADQPYTVNELAKAIARAMQASPDITHLEARNEVAHAYSAHDKVQEVFGARQQHTLDDGLRKMADWVKQHGARSSSRFNNIEILKNLPPSWRS